MWNRRASGREGYEPIGGDEEVQVKNAFRFRKKKKVMHVFNMHNNQSNFCRILVFHNFTGSTMQWVCLVN